MSVGSQMESATASETAAPAVDVARGSRLSYLGTGGLVAMAAVLAYLPYVLPRGTIVDLVTLLTLVVIGTMWNLLAGYGGMVSIGQQAFIGVGSYGTVVLADQVGLNPLLAVPVAGLLSALVAVPTSYLVFRLVGGYFAVGTWVIAEVFKLVTTQVDRVGGGSGVSLTAFAGTEPIVRIAIVYWMSLAIACGAIAGTYLLMRSRLGLGLVAIRDDTTAAGGLGVNVTRAKRWVYVASAAGFGLTGGVVTCNTLRVQPDAAYSVNFSAIMIFIVIIGGIGTIEGPVLGAILFFILQRTLAPLGSWYLVILGVVAMTVALLLPKGLWGLLSRGHVRLFPVAYTLRRYRNEP
jgi:branched-chain amino acid transport system permease protein